MFESKVALSILNKNQKKTLIVIMIFMFISMLLEAMSIGIILPLLSVLLKGEIESSFFSYSISFWSIDKENLMFFGLLITFAIFLFKNLFLIFNHWYLSIFLEKILIELSDKLFKNYLKRDYIFFLHQRI